MLQSWSFRTFDDEYDSPDSKYPGSNAGGYGSEAAVPASSCQLTASKTICEAVDVHNAVGTLGLVEADAAGTFVAADTSEASEGAEAVAAGLAKMGRSATAHEESTRARTGAAGAQGRRGISQGTCG